MYSAKINRRQLFKVGTTSFINALGASIFVYALSLYLLKVTGSAFSYGTSLFVGPIIGILLSPITGRVIDRSNHKKVAIFSEIALIIVIVLFLIVFNELNTRYLYVVAVIFISFSEICARFFTLTYLSSTPEMVDENYHQRLNSIQTMSNSVASIISAPIAGVLVAKIDFNYIICIEIITELLTLLMVYITPFGNDYSNVKRITKSTQKIDFFKNYREIVIFGFFAIISNFMNALMQIGVPYVIVNKLDKSTEVSGNLQGLFSWGVFLGGVFITLITFKSQLKVVKKIYFLNFGALAILGICLKFSSINTIIIFAIFELVLGLLNGLADPPFFTYIQSVVPRENLGQVNTYLYTIVQFLTPLGILTYSALIEMVDYKLLFFVNGLVALIMALIILEVVKVARE